MGIGKRIKEARIKKNLNQEDLAKLIGVTAAAVGNYENNISHPKESVLYKLFDALDVDPNFLFQDEVPIKDISLSFEEKSIIYDYRELNSDGKQKAEAYIKDLLGNSSYINKEETPHTPTLADYGTIAAYGRGVQKPKKKPRIT